MKKTVYKSDFIEAFQDVRPDQFSHAGLSALYDYFEEFEEDTGKEIELDVIAICCEFTEYSSIHDFVADYGDSYVDYDEEEVDYEKTIDNIRDHTSVIDIDGESFIVQNF
jgi:hypothetical protein